MMQFMSKEEIPTEEQVCSAIRDARKAAGAHLNDFVSASRAALDEAIMSEQKVEKELVQLEATLIDELVNCYSGVS
eukprot:CAMPEP_0170482712 /NCGR_PEP_ID=MMETSP0208-20121228/2607_1 /TAXON_ID=197538 /ORGANISM="Strombidium inclinatum, Strain S3" /LENGTH=75 /DNA_ID=CAMNT_0010755575 /DNA_START=2638 /DNA_END=2865 /DNA_ORIENTATION=-